MISMSCYDIMHDDVESFANKQGYTVGQWAETFTHAIRYTKVLQTWGFVSDEEAQRIYNKITVTIMCYAQEIKEPTPSGKECLNDKCREV